MSEVKEGPAPQKKDKKKAEKIQLQSSIKCSQCENWISSYFYGILQPRPSTETENKFPKTGTVLKMCWSCLCKRPRSMESWKILTLEKNKNSTPKEFRLDWSFCPPSGSVSPGGSGGSGGSEQKLNEVKTLKEWLQSASILYSSNPNDSICFDETCSECHVSPIPGMLFVSPHSWIFPKPKIKPKSGSKASKTKTKAHLQKEEEEESKRKLNSTFLCWSCFRYHSFYSGQPGHLDVKGWRMVGNAYYPMWLYYKNKSKDQLKMSLPTDPKDWKNTKLKDSKEKDSKMEKLMVAEEALSYLYRELYQSIYKKYGYLVAHTQEMHFCSVELCLLVLGWERLPRSLHLVQQVTERNRNLKLLKNEDVCHLHLLSSSMPTMNGFLTGTSLDTPEFPKALHENHTGSIQSFQQEMVHLQNPMLKTWKKRSGFENDTWEDIQTSVIRKSLWNGSLQNAIYPQLIWLGEWIPRTNVSKDSKNDLKVETKTCFCLPPFRFFESERDDCIPKHWMHDSFVGLCSMFHHLKKRESQLHYRSQKIKISMILINPDLKQRRIHLDEKKEFSETKQFQEELERDQKFAQMIQSILQTVSLHIPHFDSFFELYISMDEHRYIENLFQLNSLSKTYGLYLFTLDQLHSFMDSSQRVRQFYEALATEKQRKVHHKNASELYKNHSVRDQKSQPETHLKESSKQRELRKLSTFMFESDEMNEDSTTEEKNHISVDETSFSNRIYAFIVRCLQQTWSDSQSYNHQLLLSWACSPFQKKESTYIRQIKDYALQIFVDPKMIFYRLSKPPFYRSRIIKISDR